MSGIEGKVIVITGASSGIGEATALLLAERGAKVVLGARGSDRLKFLADRIVASGGEAAYAPTDVKRREGPSHLVGLAVFPICAAQLGLPHDARGAHSFS